MPGTAAARARSLIISAVVLSLVATMSAGPPAAASAAANCAPLDEAVAAAETVAAQTSALLADDPDADLPDGGPDAELAAEMEDIASSAAQRGMPLDAAYKQLCWQDDFAAQAEQLATTYPDTFAGAWIERGDQGEVAGSVVGFKTAVPAIANAALAPFDTKLMANRGFSEQELMARNDEVHDALIAAGFTDIVSSPDIATGRIEVELVQPTPASGAATSGPLELPATALAPDVVVKFRDSLPGVDETLHGGALIERVNASALICTSGFNVIKIGSTLRGATTAEHCRGGLTLENRDGSREWTATQRSWHLGVFGDVQWVSTGDTESDDFYFDFFNNRRDVSGTRAPVKGKELCRFGFKTGRRCGDHVYRLGVRKTVRGKSVRRLAAMHREHGETGDSGGPWYWGRYAYGLHQGEKWINLIPRDVFSQARYVDDALGVRIMH